MTLQQMHEAVMERQRGKGLPIPKLSLWRVNQGAWYAVWGHSVVSVGATADEAIKAAFDATMEVTS